MTEEEQKAIEELLLETVKNYEEYYKDTEALILTEISRDYKNSKIILNLISKQQSDIEIKDKVIDRTCKYINEIKIINKAIPVYPNKVDTPYTFGVASIEEIKQHFYEEVEKENE